VILWSTAYCQLQTLRGTVAAPSEGEDIKHPNRAPVDGAHQIVHAKDTIQRTAEAVGRMHVVEQPLDGERVYIECRAGDPIDEMGNAHRCAHSWWNEPEKAAERVLNWGSVKTRCRASRPLLQLETKALRPIQSIATSDQSDAG
jgi:hypothetical protein